MLRASDGSRERRSVLMTLRRRRAQQTHDGMRTTTHTVLTDGRPLHCTGQSWHTAPQLTTTSTVEELSFPFFFVITCSPFIKLLPFEPSSIPQVHSSHHYCQLSSAKPKRAHKLASCPKHGSNSSRYTGQTAPRVCSKED